MRVDLSGPLASSPAAGQAAAIVEACVHCGLCTATCPTYEVLDQEADSPRGRIYLIRELLQGASASAHTREHLDRCLGCRACETACPSGVQYGHLIDFGRREAERQAPRPLHQRLWRRLLRQGLTSPRLFAAALRLGQALRPVLPAGLVRRVPPRPATLAWPSIAGTKPSTTARQVLTLRGCVQPALAPQHDAALARLLAQAGRTLVAPAGTGCCGAIDQHLGAEDMARQRMRRNIDAWWPHVEQGAEAIVPSASGCAAMVADYPHLLRDDPAYAAKAQRIGALLRDPADLLACLWREQPPVFSAAPPATTAVAYHAPCTQLHALKVKGRAEALLEQAGYQLTPVAQPNLCCGSAGTYSVLQPAVAGQLRARKLAALAAGSPHCIASANIGCITHLQQASAVPVRHWLELLAERLSPEDAA